jgi:chromosome transmission fidelity protein 1
LGSLLFAQLVIVHGQLRNYLTRFSNRLAAGNRRHIQTLLTLTAAFLRRLCLTKEGDFAPLKTAPQGPMTSACASADASAAGEVMALNDFLFSLHIDNVNLFRLERYVRESNAMHKVGRRDDVMLAFLP